MPQRCFPCFALALVLATIGCSTTPSDGGPDAEAPDAGDVVEDAGLASDDPRSDDLRGRDQDEWCENETPDAVFAARSSVRRVMWQGDRIFALSPRGVTAIETSEAAARVVGRDLSIDKPIEIVLLSSDVALVLSDPDTGACSSYTGTTRLTAFDVGDPASSIPQLFEDDLEGHYLGVQRAGDMLYVTTLIDYGSRRVSSFDVSDARAPKRITSLDLMAASDVSEDPVLVASAEYLYALLQRSSGVVEIQVVPLTGTGELSVATTFELRGWLDQQLKPSVHDGTLRVITNRDQAAPALELHVLATGEEHDLSVLSSIELPPGTQDALFDGARAYVLSAERWRALDLGAPAQPLLGAALELPEGSPTLMPLGERLLVFTPSAAVDGARETFQASLFDMRDVAAPLRIDERRVDGLPKGSAARDEQGSMVAVHVAGAADDTDCQKPFIQLIDLSADAISVRDAAPLDAEAQLLFVGERVLAMSWDRAELFLVDAPDAPTRVAHLPLARDVAKLARVGEHLVAAGAGYLDVLELEPEPSSLAIGSVSWQPPDGCGWGLDILALNVDGSRVHVLYRGVGNGLAFWVVTVDVADPEAPRVVSNERLDAEHVDEANYRSSSAPLAHGFAHVEWSSTPTLRVLDASESSPAVRELVLESSVEAPALQTRGDTIYVGRMLEGEEEGRVEFVVDRIDAAGARLAVAETYAVPGRLLHVLEDGRLLTLSFRRIESMESSEDDCFALGGRVLEERGEGITCIVMQESLGLLRLEDDEPVLEDVYALPPGLHSVWSTAAEGRVFIVAASTYDWAVSAGAIVVLSTDAEARLSATQIESDNYRGRGAAIGPQLAFVAPSGDMTLIDATDPDDIVVEHEEDVCRSGDFPTCTPTESGFIARGYDGIVALEL